MWFQQSVSGLPLFVLYFGVGLVLTVLFLAIYQKVTAHDEIALIRQHNASAAVALGGNLLGFAIPLDKAIAQSASVPDCVVWALVALVVQIGVYLLVRLLIPDLSKNIENNAMASALALAFIAVAGGMLNSAAMTLYPG